MKNYKHSVSTMEVLLWESEQAPKPAEYLITMPAQEGDLAWVSSEEKEYIFQNGAWARKVITSTPTPYGGK
jgi:hypothetical protein